MSSMSYNRLSSSEELPQGAWSSFPQVLRASPSQAAATPHPPAAVLQQHAVLERLVDGRGRRRKVGLLQPVTSYSRHSSEGAQESTSGGKKSGNEPAFKEPRIETPSSSLPTFKVRKEKLSDRTTALQQLVSLFGKEPFEGKERSRE